MKKLYYILIISLVATSALGIVLWTQINNSQSKVVEQTVVNFSDEEQAELAFNLSEMYPGQNCSYTISLNGNDGDEFEVELKFQKTGSDSIAEFVDVELLVGENKIGEGKLSEYLAGKNTVFPVNFDNSDSVNVEIVYKMAVSVGNEAQNSTADFDVVLTAKR